MLLGWFSTQRHATSSKAIPTMLHGKTSDEERSRINLEVCHWVVIASVGGFGNSGGDSVQKLSSIKLNY
jgi:hypothetical protein